MDNIQTQIERLEKVIGDIQEISKADFGHSHSVTRLALRAFIYLQGLKIDYNVQKRKT